MELSQRMQVLASRDRRPFHMPGHKNLFSQLYGNFDPTELPGLDNLHCPTDVLQRAQARVAALYGTARTFFLVNGSSVGLMAALAAVAGKGDNVLVPRNCHKSILAGFVHSGAMPVWATQSLCPHLGRWLPPTPAEINHLAKNHTLKAVVLTSPDYYGLAPDLNALSELLRRQNIALIVDEAHGAHLNWGKGLGLPVSAATIGDITVQSPHKTLPALTQAAWLHIKDPAAAETLQQTLNLFQTTSPSYLLLRSLEFAGAWAQAHGYTALRRLKMLASVLAITAKQTGLSCSGPANRDWTKFIIPRRRGALRLLHQQGVYPELAEGDKFLFMLTMADSLAPENIAVLQRLLPALGALPEKEEKPIILPPLPQQEISPREAWKRPGLKVTLDRARGRIARQLLAPYPPGTTVVAPGQRLGTEHIGYLKMLQSEKVISQWLEVL